MEQWYRELMQINMMPDNEEKAKASQAFFERLNKTPLPAHFNWAEEIFEGLHVKERPNQLALIWADLDTGDEKTYTYAQLAEKSNQLLNFLRKYGVAKEDPVYIMVPVLPEIWFASIATLKGGMVLVPTAMTMTAKELEYRFKTTHPQRL